MKACLILSAIAVSAPPVLADIHDEIHACIHERLPALRRTQYNATTAQSQNFSSGIGREVPTL
jgi:hypothetical protein